MNDLDEAEQKHLAELFRVIVLVVLFFAAWAWDTIDRLHAEGKELFSEQTIGHDH